MDLRNSWWTYYTWQLTLLWHCFFFFFLGLLFFWQIACLASTLSFCSAAVCEPLHSLLPGLVLYNSFLFCIPNEASQWLMHSHSTLYSQHLLQAGYRFWLWPTSWSAKTEKTLRICWWGEQGSFKLVKKGGNNTEDSLFILHKCLIIL